jgi:hypothetical protein
VWARKIRFIVPATLPAKELRTGLMLKPEDQKSVSKKELIGK